MKIRIRNGFASLTYGVIQAAITSAVATTIAAFQDSPKAMPASIARP